MPVWLTILLTLWSTVGMLALVGAISWGRGITKSVMAMSQWFDKNSALGRSAGTLPDQIADIRQEQNHTASQLDALLERERVLERLMRVETQTAEMQRDLQRMETKARLDKSD